MLAAIFTSAVAGTAGIEGHEQRWEMQLEQAYQTSGAQHRPSLLSKFRPLAFFLGMATAIGGAAATGNTGRWAEESVSKAFGDFGSLDAGRARPCHQRPTGNTPAP